jgi:hypothetical protein
MLPAASPLMPKANPLFGRSEPEPAAVDVDDGDEVSFMRRLDCGKSSCFAAIYHDSLTRVLRMRFRTGPILYTWSPVPKAVVDLMSQAESKGEFYHERIRGRYTTDYPNERG